MARRRLTQGAGFDVLGEIGDPTLVVQNDIDDGARAAKLGDLFAGPLGRGQAPGMRQIGRQRQNARTVEVVDHR